MSGGKDPTAWQVVAGRGTGKGATPKTLTPAAFNANQFDVLAVDAPAEAPKDPTPSSPAPAPASAEAAPEEAAATQEPKQATTDPEPSAASSPTKAKSPAAAESADDTKATPCPSGEQDGFASCCVGRGGHASGAASRSLLKGAPV
jgi:hypothetical protein